MGNDDFPKAAEQASGSPCGFLWGQTALVTIGSSVPCQPMKAVDTKYTMQYDHHQPYVTLRVDLHFLSEIR